MIYVGIDWAEAHHDVCVLDKDGGVLCARRIPDGIEGVATLHELLGGLAAAPEEVAIGIETDRGLLVTALVAAGYRVHALNPKAASRYRDRHGVSGAKSDAADARMLADAIRTDSHLHRTVAEDSSEVAAIGVIARAHQSLIWSKGRQVNMLRSALREFYPQAFLTFGLQELGSNEACEVLGLASHPVRPTANFAIFVRMRTLPAAPSTRPVNPKSNQVPRSRLGTDDGRGSPPNTTLH